MQAIKAAGGEKGQLRYLSDTVTSRSDISRMKGHEDGGNVL
jgi:hypothetical protein